MANGVQLATAYISLNVRSDDIKKQVDAGLRGVGNRGREVGQSIGSRIAEGLRNSFVGSRISLAIFNPMEIAGVRWAMRAGAAIGSALKKALIGAASMTGLGAALGIGGVLTAGLERLKTIQRAQVQLSLKLPPDEIKRVTKDIQEVVRGTPIALDEALQAVPRALSAGIKPGKELNQYVQNIADAAASSGGQAGFGQIDIIFSQILSKGKLMGEELMQLAENGVDLRSALRDTIFNGDDKKLNAAIAKGKVGMREIQQAVEATWGKDGGLSKKMGNTFDGAVGNLKASIARLGANVLGVIFGDPKNPDDPLKGAIDGVTALTGKLDTAGKWVAEHREDIRGYFNGAKDTANGLIGAVSKVVDWFKRMWQGASDIGTKIGNAFTSAKTSVTSMWTTVSDTFGKIKTKLSDIVDDIKKKFDDIFGPDGWFARQFDKVSQLIDKVRDVFGIGPATANAAAPGSSVGGAAPFNPGPMAPGAFGNYPSRSGMSPGTPLDGSSQSLTAVPGANPGQQQQKPNGVIASTGKPYGLPAGTDTGGYGNPDAAKVFPSWVFTLGDRFGVKPSTYSGHQEGAGMNQGIDWVGTVEQMQAFAEFLTSAKIPGLEQVIWQNPNTKKPLGLTPDGDIVTVTDGYYRNDWGGHQDHVHTRFSQNLDLSKFSSGGGVWGAGTATSDSIPALLSNGEHVLTAKDVQAMGGQGGVYAFRQALAAGKVPGFAPGGSVDDQTLQNLNNQLADSQKASEIALAQFNETMNNPDASELDRLQAQLNLGQAQRSSQQLAADYPIAVSGGTPPDRSIENQILDSTDQLKLAQQRLNDAQAAGDVPASQMLQLQDAVAQAQRGRDQGIAALNNKSSTDYLSEFTRSAGFVPTAAGNTGVAGTSSLAGILNMGNEVVGGLIDTGASLAQTAISTAATVGAAGGTMGAGAAAGPAAGAAASYGIQVAASIGKRLSSYGFQLASIGADSLIAQAMPFGAPRWMGYDYTGFMPNLGIQQAALTTLEKMGGDAIQKYFNPQGQNGFQIPAQPQSPAAPLADPASGTAQLQMTAPPAQQATVGAPGPTSGSFDLQPWLNNLPGGGGGTWAKGGEVKIYDSGGVLRPGELALNASRRPEKVLTQGQWDALANIQPAGRDAPMVQIGSITGFSPEDVAAKIENKQKLAMMRYAGRP